jgi:hypothetical protein
MVAGVTLSFVPFARKPKAKIVPVVVRVEPPKKAVPKKRSEYDNAWLEIEEAAAKEKVLEMRNHATWSKAAPKKKPVAITPTFEPPALSVNVARAVVEWKLLQVFPKKANTVSQQPRSLPQLVQRVAAVMTKVLIPLELCYHGLVVQGLDFNKTQFGTGVALLVLPLLVMFLALWRPIFKAIAEENAWLRMHMPIAFCFYAILAPVGYLTYDAVLALHLALQGFRTDDFTLKYEETRLMHGLLQSAICLVFNSFVLKNPPIEVPTFAPTQSPSYVCNDVPIAWEDKSGIGCSMYGTQDLCNDRGRIGSGWEMPFNLNGTFHSTRRGRGFTDYQDVDGVTDARFACCACGGGSYALTVAPTMSPTGLLPSQVHATLPMPTAVDVSAACMFFILLQVLHELYVRWIAFRIAHGRYNRCTVRVPLRPSDIERFLAPALIAPALIAPSLTVRGLIERFLAPPGRLSLLSLKGCEIGNDGASLLARGLQDVQGLVALDLRGNGLGVRGKRAIGTALMKNKWYSVSALRMDAWGVPAAIAELRLPGVGLTADDLLLIAGVLKGNERIEVLDLGYNALGIGHDLGLDVDTTAGSAVDADDGDAVRDISGGSVSDATETVACAAKYDGRGIIALARAITTMASLKSLILTNAQLTGEVLSVQSGASSSTEQRGASRRSDTSKPAKSEVGLSDVTPDDFNSPADVDAHSNPTTTDEGQAKLLEEEASEGMVALATALGQNRSIRTVDLSHNNVCLWNGLLGSDSCANQPLVLAVINRVLDRNKGCVSLDMKSNGLGFSLQVKLREKYKRRITV